MSGNELSFFKVLVHNFFRNSLSRRVKLFLWAEKRKNGEASRGYNKNTELVIEGYPRSANSFVVRSITRSNPELKVAHHLHVSSSILAAKGRSPVLVLFRRPEEAVKSNLALLFQSKVKNLELSKLDEFLLSRIVIQEFTQYKNFYHQVLKYRDCFLFSEFSNSTENLNLVINRLNEKFSINLMHDDSHEADILANAKVHLGPNKERESIKNNLSVLYSSLLGKNQNLVIKCNSVYQRLCSIELK